MTGAIRKMEMIRVTVHYEGRVQGVGFRWRTTQCVAGHAVGGFVQNLPDGRVRLVLEGAAEETERARASIRAAMAHYISVENSEISPATGEFDDFEVRR